MLFEAQKSDTSYIQTENKTVQQPYKEKKN